MGFNIDGFKNAFFKAMDAAANKETVDKVINTDIEKQEATAQLNIFKAELKNISNPIGDTVGDTVNFSNNVKKEVTTDDLLAFLDPELAAKVNKQLQEKPVQTIKSATVPKVATKMAEMVDDADIDKLNAYLEIMYNSKVGESIKESVEKFNGLADVFSGNAKVIDAFGLLEQEPHMIG